MQIRPQVFNTLGLLTPSRPPLYFIIKFCICVCSVGEGSDLQVRGQLCEVDSVLSPLQGCTIHTFICCVISPTPGFYKFRYCQSPNSVSITVNMGPSARDAACPSCGSPSWHLLRIEYIFGTFNVTSIKRRGEIRLLNSPVFMRLRGGMY